MTDISIDVPPKDIAQLRRLMNLRGRLLKEDSRKTVTFAAWFIAKAASAATRLAPKTRPIVKNPAARSGDRRRAPFAAKKFTKNRDLVLIPIRAATKQEAREDKRAKIGTRGLARDAWRWVVGDLGRAAGKTLNKKMTSAYRVRKSLDRATGPEILLENRLNYAGLAFKTKGAATVNNILSRANNAMRKDLERRTAKTIKATS